MSHFQEVYTECGHVGGQCRCPGPKVTRHLPGWCGRCVRAHKQAYQPPTPQEKESRAWIGVDLDGTLATYGEWLGHGVIGEPIPLMVARVKRWLAQGKVVKIFTARVTCGENEDPTFAENARIAIEEWCLKHIGRVLPVTNKKDYGMVELWDDRAVAVIPNTGIIIGDRERGE